MHWKRWEELCKPKEIRGLNFRDLVHFNQAMLAKQVWRVLSNPNLTVSRVLCGKYFPNSSVFDGVARGNSSFSWNGFLWGMELLKRGLRKNLGNGQSIRMFRDPWLPRPITFKLITTPNVDIVNAVVAEFLTPTFQWDMVKLNQCLVQEDVEVIKGISISPSAPDHWIWHYDGRGEYTVKSGYKLSMIHSQEVSLSEQGRKSRWWKKLWKIRVPNKVKVFEWKSFHNSIPTKVNLWTHDVPVNGYCPMCKEEIETTDHALFQCNRAKEIWVIIHHLMNNDHWCQMDVKDRWLSQIDCQGHEP